VRDCIVPGCDSETRSDHWLCRQCFSVYGYYGTWPEWLKGLLVIEQRCRRSDFRSGRDDVVHLEYSDDCNERNYPPRSEYLYTRCEMDVSSGLPLGPYSTKAENAEYRRANEILSRCDRIESRYKENRELWRSVHGDRMNESSRRYQRANRERCNERVKRYLRKHPHISRRAYRKRRAREAAVDCTLTSEQESEILSWGCLACDTHKNLTIAHDIAVSNGGATTWENCFCLCQSHNSQQYTKSLLEWRPDLVDRLNAIRAKYCHGAVFVEDNTMGLETFATSAMNTTA